MLQWRRWVCCACAPYAPPEAEQRLQGGWIGGYATFTFLALLICGFSGEWFVLVIQQAFAVGLVVGIPLHEAGHAFAASAAGAQVSKVTIGRGPPVGVLRVGGVRVELARYPALGGLAQFAWLGRSVRWRGAIALVGGPAANLAAAALALTLIQIANVDSRAGDGVNAGLAGFALAQLLLAAFNLWPLKGRFDQVDSDGRQLWRLLVQRRAPGDPFLEAFQDGMILENLGRLPEARDALMEAWRLQPAEPIAVSLLLHVIGKQEGPDAALSFVRARLMELEAMGQGEYGGLPYLHVNMADVALRAGAPDMALAETYLKLAREAAPEAPAMVGTQGLLLARQGETEAGRAALIQAARTADSAGDRAQFCELLADVARRSGDATEAEAFDDIARRARRFSTGSVPA